MTKYSIAQSSNKYSATNAQFQTRRVHNSIASPKISHYLNSLSYSTPILVMDLEQVAANYDAIHNGYCEGKIYYAVKANPAPGVLKTLLAKGSYFDVASRGEIDLCLAQGIPVEKLSFGNTIKKIQDIAYAYNKGIRLFSVDAAEEIEKVALAAPQADTYVRILIGTCEADWPLSRKFGCAPEEAVGLLNLARARGLKSRGLSFHVGSQTRHPEMWRETLKTVCSIWQDAQAQGIKLDLLNIGGGFPASYGKDGLDMTTYTRHVIDLLREYMPELPSTLMMEPGRGIVANAGVIRAEVVLVSKKHSADLVRWVYIDIGKFSGLAETMDEAIRYPLETPMDQQATLGPCILAGPSCDSVDVLYEKRPVQLPLDLQAGDEIRILYAGAYTSTYSSIGFNGFPPLHTVCL